MPSETLYLVQAYTAGKGKQLKADPAVQSKAPEQAIRAAQRLEPIRLGVVAYTVTVDEELGEYSDPTILFKAGRLPPPFDEE